MAVTAASFSRGDPHRRDVTAIERADAGIHDDEPGAALGTAADESAHARILSTVMGGSHPREQIDRRET